MLSTLEPSCAEKRRHTRHHCNILVHFDSSSQSGVGVLTDVSLKGASLTCRLPQKLYGFVRLSAFTSQPSANSIWGNRRSVLAGDFLYARASTMILEDGDAEILEIFAQSIQSMAEGELLQLEGSFDTDVTETQYFDIIERKSAVLLSGACEAGAILGGVTRAERRRLSDYGRFLGLAFQLKDDALDYDTHSSVLGKRRYADLAEGKVTLPLLLTLKRCSSAEAEQISAVLKEAAKNDELPSVEAEPPAGSHEVAEIVARNRGVEDTLRRADQYVARASEAIAAFPDGPAKQALVAAAALAVARDR